MNYQKHYDLLIERAQNRITAGYIESHHIVPKCIGGSNDSNNLVNLYPEEHFLAHQLLVKIYPNEGSLVYALNMMTVNKTQRSNKRYGWIRRKIVDQLRQDNIGKTLSEEHKRKISESIKGRKHSAEHKRKIGLSNVGKHSMKRGPCSEEQKKVLSAIHKGKPKSLEHRKKLSEAAKRRAPFTAEHRRKISEAISRVQTGKPHPHKGRKKLSTPL